MSKRPISEKGNPAHFGQTFARTPWQCFSGRLWHFCGEECAFRVILILQLLIRLRVVLHAGSTTITRCIASLSQRVLLQGKASGVL